MKIRIALNKLFKRTWNFQRVNPWVSGFLICTFFLSPVNLWAEKMLVPANIQMTLLLKTLTYDQKLKDRCQDAINIGILYVNNDQSSVEAKDEVIKVLNENSDRTISKLPFYFRELRWHSADSLLIHIQSFKINIIYVCPGNENNVDAIRKLSTSKQVLTMTGMPGYVDKGLSVSIGIKNEKPQIIINLEATKAEGVDFDPKLLRIAKIVETAPSQ